MALYAHVTLSDGCWSRPNARDPPICVASLLITGRAERSGDAVNLAAAALRQLKPGHPATLPGLRSRLAGTGADDLPGRVVRGPVHALISCRGESPVLLPRDSHRPGYGLAARKLNRNP